MRLLIACLFLLPGDVLASPDPMFSVVYTIHADTQILLLNGNIKAFGAVQIISGDMKIEADEAIFHRENPNNLFVTATGTPIKYKGMLENGRPFSGHSLELKYVIESGEIILTNKAFIRLQDSTLSASVITYNLQSKKMTATSSNDTRVSGVLYPKQLSDKNQH